MKGLKVHDGNGMIETASVQDRREGNGRYRIPDECLEFLSLDQAEQRLYLDAVQHGWLHTAEAILKKKWFNPHC